jgi:hypothetical protein
MARFLLMEPIKAPATALDTGCKAVLSLDELASLCKHLICFFELFNKQDRKAADVSNSAQSRPCPPSLAVEFMPISGWLFFPNQSSRSFTWMYEPQ